MLNNNAQRSLLIFTCYVMFAYGMCAMIELWNLVCMLHATRYYSAGERHLYGNELYGVISLAFA